MTRSKFETSRAALRLATEEPIRLDDLARELYVSKESLRRWGNRGRNGVYLDTAMRGGVLYTSRAALRRFQEALVRFEKDRDLDGKTVNPAADRQK